MPRLFGILGFLMHRALVPGGLMGGAGGMMLVKLLGAVRPVEFMALAGNPEQGNGHQKDRE